jgi:NAD(P)-dependent dehydrogenase (short-subunit alcohol dehydrogenase family)
MNDFTNKTVLVTGGTTGIGLGAAKAFIAAGATVFVTGRRAPELAAAVAELGSNAYGFNGDVSNLADLDRLYKDVADHGKGLDVVFANAGGGEFATLEQTTKEHFDNTFGTNVRGALFTIQKALPFLNESASVIVVGSSAANTGTPAFGTYVATKAAIRAYARVWANELAPRGIRVNVVVPGSTRTPGLEGLAPDAETAAGMLEAMTTSIPLGRLAHVDDIASAVLFLASDEASFITGSELPVDGGQAQV